jgi:acyl carrier protein
MAQITQAVQRLLALPKSERFDALDEMVCGQFRRSLLIPDDEEIPRYDSFFEIGLTSLRLTEIRQELEELFGCAISDTEMFNQPTIEQLTEYLMRAVLTGAFDAET